MLAYRRSEEGVEVAILVTPGMTFFMLGIGREADSCLTSASSKTVKKDIVHGSSDA